MKTPECLTETLVTYRQSPYLDVTTTASGGSVFNILSGKRYELGQRALDILTFFRVPRSLDAFQAQFVTAEEANVVEWFRRHQMLVEATPDGWEAFTTSLIAVKDRLFGLPAYHDKASVVLVGIPFGKGNGRSMGGAEFPFRIREFSQKHGLRLAGSALSFLDRTTADRLRPLFLDHRLVDAGNLFVSQNESTPFLYEKMYRMARQLFGRRQRPLFIGGDHSISYPLIRAAAERFPGLHILHFDAHTDTYGSRFDAVDHAGKIHHYGNFMTHCLALDGVAKVYQIGIRGLTNAFAQSVDKQHIIWSHEAIAQLQNGLPFDLPQDVPWYVTFDVDVIDPAVLPGTATPVVGGFTVREIDQLLAQWLPGRQVVGGDVVEANPDYDATDRTTQLTAEIILKLLSHFTPNPS